MVNDKNIDSSAADAARSAKQASKIDAPRARPSPVARSSGWSDPLSHATSFHGDDDSFGDHWSVPWSDLMMVMFVLFAALLAAKMLQPDIEIRYKTLPAPEIREIEKEQLIKEEIPSRKPSVEYVDAHQRIRPKPGGHSRGAIAECRHRVAR